MSEGDTFREQAEEARKMAARSLSEADKAFWLGVAEDWIKLARQVDEAVAAAKRKS